MASGATVHSPTRLSANELRPAKVVILSDSIGNRDILPVTKRLCPRALLQPRVSLPTKIQGAA